MSTDSELDPLSASEQAHACAVGWPSFARLCERILAHAAEQGVDLTMIDADFARWPLTATPVISSFNRWAVSHRGCHARVLAQDWQAAVRQHGGWLRWHSPWSHRVACLQMQPEDAPQWPGTLLVAHGVCGLKVVDERVGRVQWTTDRQQMREWLSEVDVILQRSVSVTPLATLGL